MGLVGVALRAIRAGRALFPRRRKPVGRNTAQQVGDNGREEVAGGAAMKRALVIVAERRRESRR